MKELIRKLDLEEFLKSYEGFLARPKELFLEGDSKTHLKFIGELEKIIFTPPKEVKNLDSALALLKKFGYLKLDEIFEFVKIIRYFNYLKTLKIEGILWDWIDGIRIPEAILEVAKSFGENGEIKKGIYLELDSITESLEGVKREISQQLNYILNQNKLTSYLVDRQIHLINDEECLLLKAGFHHVLKGQILNRSSAGFFYVLPQSIANLKDKSNALNNKKEEQIFHICREISTLFTKHLLFLKFINREFDRFDSYQARLMFAKSKNLEFLAAKSDDKKIVLNEFKHPALKNPKSISLDFNGQVLMITGVNAGGKTMLLKSIISAVFLAKYLIPLPINASKSSIASFKFIHLILEDPQNSKNDISTFGGRMLQFSQILNQREGIIGVDEIELGTDSDEAASLFKVLLENLIAKNNKIIITTHHKRLAALMAGNPKVQLLAALFDEKNQIPTFSFLDGTIGKSYAFETAVRYGIPKTLVNEAKILYGEDKEKLNELIENSSRLEMKLQMQIKQAEVKNAELEQKINHLKELEESLQQSYKTKTNELESLYQRAINEAKKAIKMQNQAEIHRQMNEANKILKVAKLQENQEKVSKIQNFEVGNRVKYRQSRGIIASIQKDEAMVLLDDGMKLRVPLGELDLSGNAPKIPQADFKVQSPKNANVVLDLHGMRAEEALEKLDEFISNSLIAGFDEVLIYHGIGTGRLSSVVREFLEKHPKVVEFMDAPPKSGGFGAKIVRL
ncbi:recombination and DNA strand exchange inhibitor protein [Helicobacter pullorum MIT 98-5489]|uniref:Endonuclease MutS2 n=1 Tax=Helicobacter pullorum MIT 98-5489 TaxID=537972 RepID=C5EZD3_9HELI|nr:endonuclease MutS2 [Helicobacter pullorum]EEQ63248.1 recombination and DNA strand exchange inhibitor protein [Helicobacter pullorum MIT 98-5489]